ncbi:hypothetical protein R1flu_004916 [Riccia fluitans]|uniref:Uncharacterized protein n=1 Tax=Riccia fluitans TaxID=41844 RepID=A0ABD1YRM8_9MARC
MGNKALSCYKGKAKVAVVLVDGNVEEYFKPVRVATVLNRYPKHMVAQVDSSCQIAQRQRRVTFLRPDQKLKSEQQYVVLPNESVGSKFMDCWTLACVALESSTARRPKLRKLKARSHDHAPSTEFPCCMNSPLDNNEEGKLSTSLLRPAHQSGSSNSREMRQGLGQNVCRGRDCQRENEWRPSLESIPESPRRPFLTTGGSF